MSGVKVRFLNRNEILPRLLHVANYLLASKPEIVEISLFGSLARGNYAPGSDADIYILLRKDRRRFVDRIPEFLDFFSLAGIPVEVFPYTLEEKAEMKDGGFFEALHRDKMILASRPNL